MNQLWINGCQQCIKFVDAYQRVLVSSVPVQKLVLDQAGELSEFWDVTAKKIDPVHHSHDASHSAFLGQNRRKDRARSPGVPIGSGYMPKASAQQIFEFRTKIQLTFLRQLNCAHHLLRIIAKNIPLCRIQLFVSDKEEFTNRRFVPSC